jgi:hypothetical protein
MLEYRDEFGRLHRIDGPARSWSEGSEEWYEHGKLHRCGGPAYMDANGRKVWMQNGLFHRTDGPAVEGRNGQKAWYLNNQKISRKLFNKLFKGSKKDLLLLMGQGFDKIIAERLKNNEN